MTRYTGRYRRPKTRLAWGPFAIAMTVLGILLLVEWLVYRLDSGPVVLVLVSVVVLGLAALVLASGILALLQPRLKRDDDDA